MSQSPIITIMTNAARKVARGLQRDFGEVENLQVSVKGPGDFVTRADRKAEAILKEELIRARPMFGFLGEESDEMPGIDPAKHRWIVDPIDGTTNFIHGHPMFAISIGLERHGEVVAGLIYNPISDEMFTAERGRGAYLNDRRRLRVAARREIHDTVIGCGLPHRGSSDNERFRAELASVQGRVSGLRASGSASLDLAYVAAGRLDGYWERGLKPWDMAAGIILIREAGGTVTDTDLDTADPMITGNILVTNPDLVPDLRRLITSPAA
jgi:myo-inositol-1(or 4)-monophosphatase